MSSNSFPIKINLSLIFNQARNYFPTNIVIYQHLIEKLIYLACGTKPNIAFIVG